MPTNARRSAFSVTMVWIGFPMIITGAMTGSLLVLGMGFSRALTAMIIGNLIMFAYVGLLGLIGTKRGMNFALIASIVFGKKGYVFASGLLSTLLLGWYAVQTGITGALVSSTYGSNYVAMTIIAGLLYIGITFVGVKGLHYIGLVSVPLFVILGVWVAFDAASTIGVGDLRLCRQQRRRHDVDGRRPDGGARAVHRCRHGDRRLQPLGQDSDGFAGCRPSARFPFANLVAMLVGGVMTAALAVPNANPFGADNMFGYMNGKQMAWLSGAGVHIPLRQSRLGLLALPLQCGNRLVAHPRHHMRLMAIILGALGIVVAAGNVWAFFIQWLSLLGILVPPIGAIILVDQYLIRPNSADRQRTGGRNAFIAWAIGSVCAFIVERMAAVSHRPRSRPRVVASIAYYVIAKVDAAPTWRW